jgi:hypothetical protein
MVVGGGTKDISEAAATTMIARQGTAPGRTRAAVASPADIR